MLSKFIILIHLLVFMKINKIEAQEMPDPEKIRSGAYLPRLVHPRDCPPQGRRRTRFQFEDNNSMLQQEETCAPIQPQGCHDFSSIPLGKGSDLQVLYPAEEINPKREKR